MKRPKKPDNHLSDLDLRFGKDREIEVLRQVETFHGFHLTWLDENANRARAVDRLRRRGKIVLLNGGDRSGSGWCEFEIRPDGEETPLLGPKRGGRGTSRKDKSGARNKTKTKQDARRRQKLSKEERAALKERNRKVYNAEVRAAAREKERNRFRSRGVTHHE